MSRLPLQTLPAFSATARHGSMRAAAAELHLTHSAVSQQIKLLEQQLGVRLFDRRGRMLALSAAGAALLRAVEPALDGLAAGVRAAQAAASGVALHLRLTVLPSIAQRWLLPRMGRWRERHPDITIEIHTSQQLADLAREGFHAALRLGHGHWRGLRAEPFSDSPWVAVAAPSRAAPLLRSGQLHDIASQPLLGDAQLWEQFLAQGGQQPSGKTVAGFNDAGLMLQAAEQDLGVALVRELLAADALRAGRLVRLTPLALEDPEAMRYWFVYPPALADWAPLVALRQFLRDEMTALYATPPS